VMNDLWNLSLDKTGTTFGLLYALGVMYATQTGPMISGSLLTYHSWRWTFWLSAILMGSLSVVAFLVPETHAPEILRSRAKRENLPVMKRGDSWEVFLASIGRPLHMIIVEPVRLFSLLLFNFTTKIRKLTCPQVCTTKWTRTCCYPISRLCIVSLPATASLHL
jgi:MFS family permease